MFVVRSIRSVPGIVDAVPRLPSAPLSLRIDSCAAHSGCEQPELHSFRVDLQSCWRRLLLLRSKRNNSVFVGRQKRTADEVDAVGDGGEDSVEAFADGFGLTGQVDDQRFTTNACRLP